MEWNEWTLHHEDSSKSMSQLKITAQEMKFFFSKCDRIHIFRRICLHLLKKSSTEKNIYVCSEWINFFDFSSS